MVKKIGRPPSGEPPRRPRNFSATDQEIKDIDKLAEKECMNRSEFIRWKTLGK
jgi:hypothetical protein